jgi:hypothetical protein
MKLNNFLLPGIQVTVFNKENISRGGSYALYQTTEVLCAKLSQKKTRIEAFDNITIGASGKHSW